MSFPLESRPAKSSGSLEPAVSGPGTALVPSLESYEGRNPEEFLDFLRTISVEALLQERPAQAALDRIMDYYFGRDPEHIRWAREAGRLVLPNPYPVITLRSLHGEYSCTHFLHSAFMLADGEYYYYFHVGWPGDPVPDYLQPEDVVSSGRETPTFPPEVKARVGEELGISEKMIDWLIYNLDDRVWRHNVPRELPFNKPFNRVPISGGVAERFNTRKREWEPNIDGVYRPNLKQRLRIAGQSFVGKLRGSSRATEADRPSLPGSSGE